MTANTIPSPVTADGIVYVTSGFRGNALQAIRLADAEGDITGAAAVVWEYDRDTPYVPSPLLYGDTLYFLKHNRGNALRPLTPVLARRTTVQSVWKVSRRFMRRRSVRAAASILQAGMVSRW